MDKTRCDCCGHYMVHGEHRNDKYYYCPNCKYTIDREKEKK